MVKGVHKSQGARKVEYDSDDEKQPQKLKRSGSSLKRSQGPQLPQVPAKKWEREKSLYERLVSVKKNDLPICVEDNPEGVKKGMKALPKDFVSHLIQRMNDLLSPLSLDEALAVMKQLKPAELKGQFKESDFNDLLEKAKNVDKAIEKESMKKVFTFFEGMKDDILSENVSMSVATKFILMGLVNNNKIDMKIDDINGFVSQMLDGELKDADAFADHLLEVINGVILDERALEMFLKSMKTKFSQVQEKVKETVNLDDFKAAFEDEGVKNFMKGLENKKFHFLGLGKVKEVGDKHLEKVFASKEFKEFGKSFAKHLAENHMSEMLGPESQAKMAELFKAFVLECNQKIEAKEEGVSQVEKDFMKLMSTWYKLKPEKANKAGGNKAVKFFKALWHRIKCGAKAAFFVGAPVATLASPLLSIAGWGWMAYAGLVGTALLAGFLAGFIGQEKAVRGTTKFARKLLQFAQAGGADAVSAAVNPKDEKPMSETIAQQVRPAHMIDLFNKLAGEDNQIAKAEEKEKKKD